MNTNSFLVNLVRRGAGLQRNVVPPAVAGMTPPADMDSQGIREIVSEEPAAQPTGQVRGRSAAIPNQDLLTGEPTQQRSLPQTPTVANNALVYPEHVSVRRQPSPVETPLGDAPGKAPGKAQSEADQPATPARTVEPPLGAPPASAGQAKEMEMRPQTDEAPHVLPKTYTDDAAGSRQSQMQVGDELLKAIAAGVDRRADSTIVPQPNSVGEPLMTKELVTPSEPLSSVAGADREASVPQATIARPQPQPSLEHVESVVARPPAVTPSYAIDREAQAHPSAADKAHRQLEGLIERLESLVEQVERKQAASQPQFQHTPQPKRRPPTRGFSELAALRRHVGRKWY